MSARWQQILAQGFGDVQALLSYLGLPVDLASQSAATQFAVRVPRGFADRMTFGDAKDPLLRQVLAIEDETQVVDGFVPDPLDEVKKNPLPGLIHKYHGRVLLTVAGACAINCRYCFRRHFPYHQNSLSPDKLNAILNYIESDSSIHEVILSGGDPLLLNDQRLSSLFGKIESIGHVNTIRIHTRIPIVLPERITTDLLNRMSESRCQVVMVLHSNHPNEYVTELLPILQSLRQAGVHLLNQAVLLNGVNDDIITLASLSHTLFKYGIMPYYIHTLDKVSGAAHFDIDQQKAIKLYNQLQALLPGYLVPKLVTEKAGVGHKLMINRYEEQIVMSMNEIESGISD